MTRSTRIRTAGIAAVAAITLSACGGGGSSSDSSAGGGSPAEGGDLTIARQADILSMDKTTTFDNSSIYVMEQIMEPMFLVSQVGTNVEPWLSTVYTISVDKLT
jgi:peptide/nickel transport system substrate-binding protein